MENLSTSILYSQVIDSPFLLYVLTQYEQCDLASYSSYPMILV